MQFYVSKFNDCLSYYLLLIPQTFCMSVLCVPYSKILHFSLGHILCGTPYGNGIEALGSVRGGDFLSSRVTLLFKKNSTPCSSLVYVSSD